MALRVPFASDDAGHVKLTLRSTNLTRSVQTMERRAIFSVRRSWLVCATLWLSGCSAYSPAYIPASPAPPRAVQSAPAPSRVTLASWYGPGFVGQHTASGEVYHRDDLTAASR